MTTNAERIQNARNALISYACEKQDECSMEETLIDLMADLLHLAQSYEFDPQAISRMASAHYVAERTATRMTKNVAHPNTLHGVTE